MPISDPDAAGSPQVAGRLVSAEECDRLWAAWTPAEVAERMSGVTVAWCVSAGWALELFTGGGARKHSDLEIAVPQDRFSEVVAAFPGFEWDVIGDDRIWPFPAKAADFHQTWLREPATGRYRLDVFREPHVGDRWVCRRDPTITLPYEELIRHTSEGIPYATPEVALLFKAKARRDKDEADFRRALPAMDRSQRSRLFEWLSRVHPDHPWLESISTHPD
ncbi:nucleotidyltransferase domain-containing protein [Nocardia sp. NPDC050408]|uniref:nucleotidyltransferase domain-containing protein n=1 Tax=unclassified Nocardia TaxID=2637762 RepID=UPI003442CBAD